MTSRNIRIWAGVALGALLGGGLTACGGGSSDPADAVLLSQWIAANTPPPAPPPPADTRVQVRSITVFGDSMSDVGSYWPATGDSANPGKFTVNPGPVWVENIADFYGLALSPNRALTLDRDASGIATAGVGTATVVGGNGYAEGGARVDAFPSESGIGNNQVVAPITVQVNHYLDAKTTFPADELVVINGGGNDAYAQFSAVCWGTEDNGPGTGGGNTSIADATEEIAKAANAQVANVRRIHGNGAPVVLVGAASDWSGNPFAQYYLSDTYQNSGCYTPVPAAQITAWVAQFNRILQDGIADLPNVIYLDAAADVADAVANPSKYGLVNVTDLACTNTVPTNSSAFCTADTLAASDAAQTYLWSDSFHLTPRGHRIFSDAALALLQASTRRAD